MTILVGAIRGAFVVVMLFAKRFGDRAVVLSKQAAQTSCISTIERTAIETGISAHTESIEILPWRRIMDTTLRQSHFRHPQYMTPIRRIDPPLSYHKLSKIAVCNSATIYADVLRHLNTALHHEAPSLLASYTTLSSFERTDWDRLTRWTRSGWLENDANSHVVCGGWRSP